MCKTEEYRDGNKNEGQSFCSETFLELLNACKNHAGYKLAGVNDTIEFLGYVLHDLENTTQHWLHPFLCHATMVRNWITVQFALCAKERFLVILQVVIILSCSCSFHMKWLDGPTLIT